MKFLVRLFIQMDDDRWFVILKHLHHHHHFNHEKYRKWSMWGQVWAQENHCDVDKHVIDKHYINHHNVDSYDVDHHNADSHIQVVLSAACAIATGAPQLLYGGYGKLYFLYILIMAPLDCVRDAPFCSSSLQKNALLVTWVVPKRVTSGVLNTPESIIPHQSPGGDCQSRTKYKFH